MHLWYKKQKIKIFKYSHFFHFLFDKFINHDIIAIRKYC